MLQVILISIIILLNVISLSVSIVVFKRKQKGGSVDTSSLEGQMYNNNKTLMDGINNNLMTTHNAINNLTMLQKQELENIRSSLNNVSQNYEARISKITTDINYSLSMIRQENTKQFNENLITTQNAISNISSLQKQELENIQKKVDDLSVKNEAKIEKLTSEVSANMNLIRKENEKQLDAMRNTVDEKLNVSLSQRLNESFAKIQSSLEHVDTGLGEMKALANGVGDLKKMLSNVKTRGVWGEVMLSTLLEQMLSPQQFKSQVQIKNNSKERVDFVVVMPGKDDRNVYLPIDSKFPLDDYYRLSEASDKGSVDEMEKCHKAIVKRIKDEAKSISEKYVEVPTTTDFAVLFLPIEGLYAEIVRDVELVDFVQNTYKIVICGPTTLAALLNSLQMGFKTLYIEKRSSEIWGMLSTFKNEFEKFVQLLLKTQNKLNDANNTIEQATKSSRKIAKKLSNVSQVVGIDYEDTEKLTFDTGEEENGSDEV